MKRFKKLLSAVLIFFILFTLLPETANAEVTGWQSAFLNDVDGDGTLDMLPLVFNGTTSFTYYQYFQTYSILPKDPEKYGFPQTDLSVASYERLRDSFARHYGFSYDAPESEEYINGLQALKDTYGEDHKEYVRCLKLISDLNAMRPLYYDEYLPALEKWQADVDAVLEANPDIVWGHTVNPYTSYTETKENPLLYWIHIPYDYDPDKEYPVFVYAHGEDQSLGIAKYINDDGTYKVSSVSMSGDIGGLMNQWYSLVKEPGEARDKYDCFFIYICNTNGFFRGTKDGYIYNPEASNPYYEQGGIAIVNQYNDYDADVVSLTDEVTGDSSYNASYKRTYDASRLSPGINEQLVCELIDDLMTKYSIDEDRQYVMGFSLGGIYTMDIIAHYPDRFACAVPICTASADISDENCRALVDTNIWAISGNGDGTCSKYFSKLFVQAVNDAKEKYGTGSDTTVQYSFFSGGHSGAYAGPTLRTAVSGVSITSDMQVIDFVFNSRRGHSTILCTLDGVSYGDFDLAMAEAASSGKTLVLSSDMTDIDFKDFTFTLDLNGHELSGTSLNAQNVTVINSDAENSATLSAVGVYHNDVSAIVADGFDSRTSSPQIGSAEENEVFGNTEGSLFSVEVICEGEDRNEENDGLDIYADDTVNVTVKVNGARFAAADVTLSYDSELFTAVSSPDSMWTGGDGCFRFSGTHGDKGYFEDGAVLGSFTFKAKAAAEDKADVAFSLSGSDVFVSGAWSEGSDFSGATPISKENIKDSAVNIILKEMSAAVSPKESLTYNGKAQKLLCDTFTAEDLVSGNELADASAEYACVTEAEAEAPDFDPEALSYSSAVPTATAAGDYVVYYRINRPGFITVSGSADVSIARAPLTLVWTAKDFSLGSSAGAKYKSGEAVAEDFYKIYSETAAALPVAQYESLETGKTETANVTVTSPKGAELKALGSYTVTAAISDNYELLNPDCTVYIDYGTISGYSLQNTAEGAVVPYDGKHHTAAALVKALPNVPSEDSVTVSYSTDGVVWQETVPVFTEIGKYTVTMKVTAENYSEYTETVSFEIREPTVREKLNSSIDKVISAISAPKLISKITSSISSAISRLFGSSFLR